LALAPTVGSDSEQLRQLAVRTEPDAWRAALFLVRGRPFCGLRNPDWTVLEGIEAEITETVADLALRLAEHHLAARDGRRAAAVARRGLLACPFDERLYRVLLRAADASGNPAGVESAMSELLGAVAGVPVGVRPIWPESLALVHPETAALYEALSRRPAPAPGGSLARL
jgi:hypothetical protein